MSVDGCPPLLTVTCCYKWKCRCSPPRSLLGCRKILSRKSWRQTQIYWFAFADDKDRWESQWWVWAHTDEGRQNVDTRERDWFSPTTSGHDRGSLPSTLLFWHRTPWPLLRQTEHQILEYLYSMFLINYLHYYVIIWYCWQGRCIVSLLSIQTTYSLTCCSIIIINKYRQEKSVITTTCKLAAMFYLPNSYKTGNLDNRLVGSFVWQGTIFYLQVHSHDWLVGWFVWQNYFPLPAILHQIGRR